MRWRNARRRPADLSRLTELAAKYLPEGCELRLCVEKGAGWVELDYRGEPTQQIYSDEGLAAAWVDAVREARRAAFADRELSAAGV